MRILCSLFLLTLLVCAAYAQKKYTCCMPHAHTVHAKVNRVSLTNCENGQCQFGGYRVITEKHMPDFYHRRYRLDLKVEMNGQVVSDETTMGFLEPEPSNFGVEYVFNQTTCQCKQLTRPDQHPYLMLSCVDSDFEFDSIVQVGISSMQYVKAQKFVRSKTVNGTTSTDVMIVQPVDSKQPPLPSKNDPYPADYDCAIIQEDSTVETRNEKGQLVSLGTISSFCWDFLPYNTDSDYVVPAYCPKCN